MCSVVSNDWHISDEMRLFASWIVANEDHTLSLNDFCTNDISNIGRKYSVTIYATWRYLKQWDEFSGSDRHLAKSCFSFVFCKIVRVEKSFAFTWQLQSTSLHYKWSAAVWRKPSLLHCTNLNQFLALLSRSKRLLHYSIEAWRVENAAHSFGHSKLIKLDSVFDNIEAAVVNQILPNLTLKSLM